MIVRYKSRRQGTGGQHGGNHCGGNHCCSRGGGARNYALSSVVDFVEQACFLDPLILQRHSRRLHSFFIRLEKNFEELSQLLFLLEVQKVQALGCKWATLVGQGLRKLEKCKSLSTYAPVANMEHLKSSHSDCCPQRRGSYVIPCYFLGGYLLESYGHEHLGKASQAVMIWIGSSPEKIPLAMRGSWTLLRG